MTILPPNLPKGMYRTFQISSPLATHYRPATCEETGCEAYTGGWRSSIDEATELGQRQAHYIRRESGRRFSEYRDDAGLTVFTFEAGQACFGAAQHTVRLDRPEIYTTKRGWYGCRGGERQHANAADWVDDFQTNQDWLKTRADRG